MLSFAALTTALLFALQIAPSATPAGEGADDGRTIPMLVSAEWLADNLDQPGLVVVQVDQRATGYQEGHLPGARYLAYERIAEERDGVPTELLPVEALRDAFESVGVGDGVRVVLYGAPLSAARAWMTLDYLGASAGAAILDGGIAAWRASDLPLTTEVPAVEAAVLTVNPVSDRVVPAAFVEERIGDPAFTIVDARPLNEYTGADGGMGGRLLAGHIPGARHLYWEELIVSTADPRLLPLDDLRARFEAAGASEDRAVIVYCYIGMRASMAYFVSRMLGYETHLYDGSWFDWSARNLPVEAGPDRGAVD
jgi:thiosulfate/3-mercaptopyruvate sulfurtransferase